MKIEQEKDLSEVKVKRVIICCNGFINTKKHNLKCFKDYLKLSIPMKTMKYV